MNDLEITNITASYSRKINHAVYGGEQYESSDHFCSMSACVDETKDLTEVHRLLMDGCKELVGTSSSNEILKIQGGKPWKEFLSQLREYRLGKLELTDDIFHSWNRDQKAVYEEMKKLKRLKTLQTDNKQTTWLNLKQNWRNLTRKFRN